VVPAVSAVHVAGTQSTAFEVAKLVEHEQRGDSRCRRNGRSKRYSPARRGSGSRLNPCRARCHGVAFGRVQGRSTVGKSSEVLGPPEPLRLEAPHLTRRRRAPLRRFAADNPAHRRIVGQAASFTSSYPARRPNTDCRNSPANACRLFLPLRASARTSPAISVKPSTSSSSR